MLLGSFSSAIKKWRALQGRVRWLYTARPGEAWRGRIAAAALGLAPTAPGATRCAGQQSPDKCVNQCCVLLLRHGLYCTYTK